MPEDGGRPTSEERRSMTGEEGSNGVSLGIWRPPEDDSGVRQCEWKDEDERRPRVDGSMIEFGSAVDSMYWVIALGAGETNRVRSDLSRDRCGS